MQDAGALLWAALLLASPRPLLPSARLSHITCLPAPPAVRPRSFMRGRFHAAESQLGDGGAEGGAELSFLGMADKLNRMDAAKLFYQLLGAHFTGSG